MVHTREALMIEKLDLLVRFWGLAARHATLGHPLVASEQAELLSLMQLVHTDARLSQVGHAGDCDDTLPAQLIGGGLMVPVELREVSPSGLQVGCSDTVDEGARVVVRATDALQGVEYVIPCRVAWVRPGSPSTLALVVDGTPTRKTLFSGVDVCAVAKPVWESPLQRVA
jgi:hypothetical protein